MDEREVDILRLALARAKDAGQLVFWFDCDGGCHTVLAVPTEMSDPDKTGTKDWIAWIAKGRRNEVTGHIDLSNADKADFLIADGLFHSPMKPFLYNIPLGDRELEFLHLLLRSPKAEGDWCIASPGILEVIDREALARSELVEVDRLEKGARIRLTPRGMIVADYL